MTAKTDLTYRVVQERVHNSDTRKTVDTKFDFVAVRHNAHKNPCNLWNHNAMLQ